MGMPIENELTLKEKLEDVKLDASSADAVKDTTVYHNRIEYNLLETQKALNGYDLKSKKGQFFPNLQRTEVIRWLIRIIASVIFIKQISFVFTLG